MKESGSLSEDELTALISKIVKSGRAVLDSNEIKRIKHFCKSSKNAVEVVYRKLWSHLITKHSEIRLACLQLIDIFFMRSAHFRSLVIDNFNDFFNLTMGTETKLPQPIEASKQLRLKSIEFFKNWHDIFSPAYKEITLAKKYLIECQKLNLENIEENVEVSGQESVQRVRLNKAFDEFETVAGDIESSIKELEQCFSFLLPNPQEFDLLCRGIVPKKHTTFSELEACPIEDTPSSADESNYEEVQSEVSVARQQHENLKKIHTSGTVSLVFNKKDKIKIYENSSNKDIISKLTEMLHLLKNKYLVLVKQTLRIYCKYQASASMVTSVTELKNKLQKVIDKADRLLLIKKDEDEKDDEDEDEFVVEASMKSEVQEMNYLMEVVSALNSTKDPASIDVIQQGGEFSTETASCFLTSWKVGDPLPKGKYPVAGGKSSLGGPGVDRSKDYWRDEVLDKKLSKAIGVDLTANASKRMRRKKNGITDLKAINKNTAKKRLMEVLSKKKEKKKKGFMKFKFMYT